MSKKKTMMCGRPKLAPEDRLIAVPFRLKQSTIDKLTRHTGIKRGAYMREAIEKKLTLDFGD